MNMIIGIQPSRITLLENLFIQDTFSYSYNWQNCGKIIHVQKKSIVQCFIVPVDYSSKRKQTNLKQQCFSGAGETKKQTNKQCFSESDSSVVYLKRKFKILASRLISETNIKCKINLYL